MIIVGLGNPGEKYKNTFHNIGYGVADALSKKFGKDIKKLECSSITAVASKNGEKIVLAKPLTYMNLSGQAVKSLLAKYGEALEDLIIVYDDIDLDRFSIRARMFGSAGTHNGMRNITNVLCSNNFKRIRIGIGRDEGDLCNYVLSSISKNDSIEFQNIFDKVAEEIYLYTQHKDFEKLMRNLNTGKGTNEI